MALTTFFILFLSIFMVEKCDFPQVVILPYLKIPALVTVRSFFSTHKYFPERMVVFCLYIQKNVFEHKNEHSSWSQQKTTQFSRKVLQLDILNYLGSASKLIFSTYREICEKSLDRFLGECVRNNLLIFELPIIKNCGGRGWPFCKSSFFHYPWF